MSATQENASGRSRPTWWRRGSRPRPGDERTLREFVVGDHMRDRVAAGRTAVLVLINDGYDALSRRSSGSVKRIRRCSSAFALLRPSHRGDPRSVRVSRELFDHFADA
jgi:hypothetical protein